MTPTAIREAVKGQEFDAPNGHVKIDPENLHTYLTPRIAQWLPNGQGKIIDAYKEPTIPLPYVAYGETESNLFCTAKGLDTSKLKDLIGVKNRLPRTRRGSRVWGCRMLEVLFIGLSVGSILLLVALGLAITYGAMGVINMAHGEMVMIGAYVTVLYGHLARGEYLRRHSACLHRDGADRTRHRARHRAPSVWPPARHPARDLGHRDPDPAGGAARIRPVVLRHPHRRVSGPGCRMSAFPPRCRETFTIGGAEINRYRAFIIVVTAMLTAATWLHHVPHPIGTQVRAIIRNPKMAAACGIDVERGSTR